MPLNDKDFLQIDATIIAGLLILLTISSIVLDTEIISSETIEKINNQTETENNQDKSDALSSTKFLAWAMIMPFSVSALLTLYHSFAEEGKRSKRTLAFVRGLNYGIMSSGFIYIVVFIFWIALM